ncbi:MAG: STAS domain-containing protein [Thermodesulfobacteriota bacterium]
MESSVITIAGDLTIYNSSEVKAGIMEEIGEMGSVTIDLQQLGDIDVTGIQLLLAARKSAEQTGRPFQLLNPTPVLLEKAAKIGIDPALFQ